MPENETMPWSGKINCSECGNPIPCIATAYGFRAVCEDEGIMWTRIRGEQDWVRETYSPIGDNRG